MQSLTNAFLILLLTAAIVACPLAAQTTTASVAIDVASLPPCGLAATVPGMFCAFANDIQNIDYRPGSFSLAIPPPVAMIKGLGLNYSELVHRGEILSLYVTVPPTFNGTPAIGPATALNGISVTANGVPTTMLFMGWRRDGNTMAQDNVELDFLVPNVTAGSDGKIEFGLVLTDVKGNVTRGSNSPFRLALSVARAQAYELVFPVNGGQPELRIHHSGIVVATFPGNTATAPNAK